MSTDTNLLRVAHPSKRNTQQTAQNTQQPTQQMRNKPASLKALAEGILSKDGRNSARNNDATTLLRSPSPESAVLQQVQQEPEVEDYTQADLAEMDRLLHELARLEGWSDAELADKLDQRKRMAPVNVPAALRLLRSGAKAARDVKPEKPKRVPIVLCVIQGGKE